MYSHDVKKQIEYEQNLFLVYCAYRKLTSEKVDDKIIKGRDKGFWS